MFQGGADLYGRLLERNNIKGAHYMQKSFNEKKLFEYSQTAYQKKIYRVGTRVSHFVSYGHSNCTVIEGDTSLILVDALDTDTRAEHLKSILEETTGKAVKTIIFTHGHLDHRGGSGAFRDTAEEVIAFAPRKPLLKYTEKIADELGNRGKKQFGYALSDEELITQGLGIREGHTCDEGKYDFLPPTTVYTEEIVERVIDGVPLRLVSASGETEDQIFVWLPEDKVLCCGDNYYACWPNLYAIRGGQYRDVAAWLDSLECILSYPAEALLPGHTAPIFGREKILEVLGCYKEAIESIFFQTLGCIAKGMTINEAAESVALPEHLVSKPFLGEFYGAVMWSAKAIYQGYIGWFDGNPTNLNPLSDKAYAVKMIELIGGQSKVISTIEKAISDSEFQWALQLCDLIISVDKYSTTVRNLKAKSLLAFSKQVTWSNGRHYYLACAKELEG